MSLIYMIKVVLLEPLWQDNRLFLLNAQPP